MSKTGDVLAIADCHTSGEAASWVTVDAKGRHPELESYLSALCLNVYGGMPKGCHADAMIHGGACGEARAGDWLAWDAAGQIKLAAPESCPGMCVSVQGAAPVLSKCGDNATWVRTVV